MPEFNKSLPAANGSLSFLCSLGSLDDAYEEPPELALCIDPSDLELTERIEQIRTVRPRWPPH